MQSIDDEKIKKGLDQLKRDMGAMEAATALGLSSTDTLAKWIRGGVPKSKIVLVDMYLKNRGIIK